MTQSSVDTCLDRLHRAGWSVGDMAALYRDGWTWIVSGTKGEHRIIAKGRSEAEAWEQARRLAESVECPE